MGLFDQLKSIFKHSNKVDKTILGNPNVSIDIDTVDEYGVLEIYQLTSTTLINLCGGIPEGVTDVKVRIKSISNNGIEVNIHTSLYNMSRTIYFEERIIINNAFELPKHNTRGKGVGTNCLYNQVLAAKAKKFSRIELYARGGTDNAYPHSHNGHYTWARLGFEMSDNDKIVFRGTMIEWMRKEVTISELLSTDEGRHKWRHEGHGWDGYFDLTENSDCIKRLNNYLIEKGIRKAV
ncbi:MAG: hypothetical protein QM802_02340 [Agriterribacter sp.]